MIYADLPMVNAVLNTLSACLLVLGRLQIHRGRRHTHRRVMTAALVTSGLFLISYLIYHAQVGSVPYPYHDWTRPVYFAVLIPHVLLAALMVPFILIAVWHAVHQNYVTHRRLARWVWPVWMFVSLSGIVVYWMLYRA